MAYASIVGTEDDETCLWQYGCRTSISCKGDPLENKYRSIHGLKNKKEWKKKKNRNRRQKEIYNGI